MFFDLATLLDSQNIKTNSFWVLVDKNAEKRVFEDEMCMPRLS